MNSVASSRGGLDRPSQPSHPSPQPTRSLHHPAQSHPNDLQHFPSKAWCEVGLEELEDAHLRRLGETKASSAWRLATSPVAGRGLFAARNLAPGDVILTDLPLVVGPRAGLEPAVCVTCLRTGARLAACRAGCRLPLCPSCLPTHPAVPECGLLLRLGPAPGPSWSPELYRALAPLRCLTLTPDQAALIAPLQPLSADSPSLEVRLVRRGVGRLSEAQEVWLERCARVLDGVAFEAMLGPSPTRSTTTRALYPLAGLMNHSCCPNTMHWTGEGQEAVFVATRPINQGEEIFTSYCPVLWATHLRREFLLKTKQFLCQCHRCLSPTELGTELGMVGCGCGGMLRPREEEWRCEGCNKTMSTPQMTVISGLLAQGAALAKFHLPETNYLALQAKLKLLVYPTTHISDIPFDELRKRKEDITRILEVVEKLNLGDCRTKGLLLFELYQTLNESAKRNLDSTSNEVMTIHLSEAKRIIGRDTNIPERILACFRETASLTSV